MPPPPSIARYPNAPSTLPPDRRSCGPSRPFPAGPPSLMSGQSVFRPARLTSSCSLPFRPCSSHKKRALPRAFRSTAPPFRAPKSQASPARQWSPLPLTAPPASAPDSPPTRFPRRLFPLALLAAGCPRAAVFPRPKPGSSPSSRRLSVLPPIGIIVPSPQPLVIETMTGKRRFFPPVRPDFFPKTRLPAPHGAVSCRHQSPFLAVPTPRHVPFHASAGKTPPFPESKLSAQSIFLNHGFLLTKQYVVFFLHRSFASASRACLLTHFMSLLH